MRDVFLGEFVFSASGKFLEIILTNKDDFD